MPHRNFGTLLQFLLAPPKASHAALLALSPRAHTQILLPTIHPLFATLQSSLAVQSRAGIKGGIALAEQGSALVPSRWSIPYMVLTKPATA